VITKDIHYLSITTTHLRTRQLEITASLYSLSKGLRAIYCSEKIPRSRIRGVVRGYSEATQNILDISGRGILSKSNV